MLRYKSSSENKEERVMVENMKVKIVQMPPKAWDSMTIAENRILRSGDLLIDPYGKVVYKNGKMLKVTILQFELICYLVENVTLTVSRSSLKEVVYRRFGHRITDNTLSKHINRLRKILGIICDDGVYILTSQGRGYKWAVPVESSYIIRQIGMGYPEG